MRDMLRALPSFPAELPEFDPGSAPADPVAPGQPAGQIGDSQARAAAARGALSAGLEGRRGSAVPPLRS
jgi:hypothetical protein